jgi:hypothetical protein
MVRYYGQSIVPFSGSQCGTKDENDFCVKLNELHVQNVLNSLARAGCIKWGYSPN